MVIGLQGAGRGEEPVKLDIVLAVGLAAVIGCRRSMVVAPFSIIRAPELLFGRQGTDQGHHGLRNRSISRMAFWPLVRL
ncbi:hypothetical protein C6569_15945 [Phreatobacter cathodiphilus]|uniref:Uncharacterized protein n=1 Tax=Phreatobacter cathodiphilus TaxID=1868589 RepID=A0A2S0NE42_9HYPH|nr:hypothetical protein C6569_15945 [Phreatobacter cathodiphilus]